MSADECRAPDCADSATVHAHLDDGRLLPLCEAHALELVPDDSGCPICTGGFGLACGWHFL